LSRSAALVRAVAVAIVRNGIIGVAFLWDSAAESKNATVLLEREPFRAMPSGEAVCGHADWPCLVPRLGEPAVGIKPLAAELRYMVVERNSACSNQGPQPKP